MRWLLVLLIAGCMAPPGPSDEGPDPGPSLWATWTRLDCDPRDTEPSRSAPARPPFQGRDQLRHRIEAAFGMALPEGDPPWHAPEGRVHVQHLHPGGAQAGWEPTVHVVLPAGWAGDRNATLAALGYQDLHLAQQGEGHELYMRDRTPLVFWNSNETVRLFPDLARPADVSLAEQEARRLAEEFAACTGEPLNVTRVERTALHESEAWLFSEQLPPPPDVHPCPGRRIAVDAMNGVILAAWIPTCA